MKDHKKACAAAIAALAILVQTAVPYAAETPAEDAKAAYLREDVTITYGGKSLEFMDEKGDTVYPLTYKGSTYLPVRAVSGLMREPVEWVGRASTIYIGRTISAPVKKLMPEGESPYVAEKKESDTQGSVNAMRVVKVREQKKILVMYDFEILTFKDEEGKTILPVNYNGSNYLPVRTLSELTGRDIAWDAQKKTVSISLPEGAEDDQRDPLREETALIKALYDKEAEIYNLATSNIAGISEWTEENAPLMAAAISENYDAARRCKNEIIEVSGLASLNEAEKNAAVRLSEFAEINEYYILVMENISYMKLEGSDYSALAETFMNFAIMSENANKAALEAIDML